MADDSAVRAAGDEPMAIEELLEIVGELDATNEHLRMKVLDLMRLMEDAVTAQVAAERQRDEFERRLDAALAAIEGSRTLKMTRPLRRAAERIGRLVRRDESGSATEDR